MKDLDRGTCQVVWRRCLTAYPRAQFRSIYVRFVADEVALECFCREFLRYCPVNQFALAPYYMCDSPDQAVYYLIPGLWNYRLIFDPACDQLQNKEYN